MHTIILRLIGLLGVVIFLPLFVLTFLNPHKLERAAAPFIKSELEAQLNEKLDAIGPSEDTKLGALLGKVAGEKISELKSELKNGIPVLVNEQLEKMKNLSCECRKQWRDRLRVTFNLKAQTLASLEKRFTDFTQAKYMQIVSELVRDLRIFLGANSVAFLALLLISFLKPAAMKQLFVPGLLLAAASLVCSYFYLFEQNWFYSIVYSDYVGFTYLGFLGVVFAALLDIVLNRALITTTIVNAVLKVVGSAASAVSC